MPGDNPHRELAQPALNPGLNGFFARRQRIAAQEKRRGPLSSSEVLAWADAHYGRTGKWPNSYTGRVHDAPGENWEGIHFSLYLGLRGLSGGVSLAQFLEAERGYRNLRNLPELSEEEILQWADEHHERTGAWPNAHSGSIADAPGETWSGVNAALHTGGRGLTGGSSLTELLVECRGTYSHLY